MATIIDDNEHDDASRNATIEVAVEDQVGDPVAGVTVKLENRGGPPRDVYGDTDTDGRVVFIEGVGPPPCNTLTVKIEDEDLEERVGCFNGTEEGSATLVVETDEPAQPADGPVDGDTIIVASVGAAAAVVGIAWVNSR